MIINKAERLKKLPPYLFAELDRKRLQLVSAGKDIINLGIGDPDYQTPKLVRDKLKEVIDEKGINQYSSNNGLEEFRNAIAKWYRKGFSVELDPATEILPLIGSKEGIVHISLAMLNPGEISIIPDPCYPPYLSGCIFAGGEPYRIPLTPESGFLPELEKINEKTLAKTKLIFLNYPNNPTGACANLDFLKKSIEIAKEHNIIVCYDNAYSEIYYDEKPISVLQVKTAKDVAVEFHSLSKTFNMTGWRIGWACGNKDVLKILADFKANTDSGVFNAIQKAGAFALLHEDSLTPEIRKVYLQRLKIFEDFANKVNLEYFSPKGTFYLWIKVPQKTKFKKQIQETPLQQSESVNFCGNILEEAQVVITPGIGFGSAGEGYFRIALTVSDERLKEAFDRIARFL